MDLVTAHGNDARAFTADADLLFHDRARFRSLVYTPLEQAIAELGRRRRIRQLQSASRRLLSNDVPEPFCQHPRLALLRYINTPNHETLRFLNIATSHTGIVPLLCEFPQDKFVPSNTSKRMLGKLAFASKGHPRMTLFERLSIIDFLKSQNCKIADIQTVWGQPLVAFHHELFRRVTSFDAQRCSYDISSWYRRRGPNAKQYYASLLALFVRDGILFENFIINQKEEAAFFRGIFLPAFLEVWKATGVKPLIVALEPPESEGHKYWLSYPAHERAFVQELVGSIRRHGS